jgi:hypothetical protein
LSGTPAVIERLMSTSRCSCRRPSALNTRNDELPKARIDRPVDRSEVVARLVMTVILKLEAAAAHAGMAQTRTSAGSGRR